MALHKTDANNNLIQIAGNINMAYTGTSLPIGAIFSSAIPQTSNKYHLLDGGCISIQGIYKGFYNLLLSLVNQGYTITCSADEYAKALNETGNSGRFVINMSSQELVGTYTNEDEIVTDFTIPAYSIKLPTITRFIQGINNIVDIGNSIEAGLPNITGSGIFGFEQTTASEINGAVTQKPGDVAVVAKNLNTDYKRCNFSINASLSNPIYGNSETVQPASVQYPYYIVLISGASTNIQANPTITGEEQILNSINIGGVNYLLGGGITQKVLWTNPSPSSSFTAQTITTLDMTEYDYIQIFYGLSTGYSDNNELSIFIERGKDSVLNCIQWFGQGYTSWRRTVTYTSSTKIDFTDAIYGSGSNEVDNKICIPLKIIGIKLIESPTQITNKYSTEETPIGVWIDGKTIYRQVINGSATTTGIVYTFDEAPKNYVDTVIKWDTAIYGSNPNIATNYYLDSKDYIRIVEADGNIYAHFGENYPVRPFKFTIIFEYTKSTS